MHDYALFYLQPLFDAQIEPMHTALSARFRPVGYHATTLAATLQESNAPCVILCDRAVFVSLLASTPTRAFQAFVALDPGETIDEAWLHHPALLDYSMGPPDPQRLLLALNRTYSQLQREQELARLSGQLALQRNRLQDLNEIGAALSTERNLDRLLDKILASCMEITASDSGSLYLLEGQDETEEPDQRHLRFKWARNQSLDVDFSEFTIPMNERSIAGSVALHGQALNISDVYRMAPDVPYGFNKSFDQNTGYHSQSMLSVPMKNPQGEVIGLIQMINKKREAGQPLALGQVEKLRAQILPYSHEDEELLSSLASQAAIAIENARLYAAIQSLFEGFIKASVQAIESRDPTTSGHSERVAVLTVGLAQHVDSLSDGPFAHVHFSRDDLKEIKYASLLHDFGKIGVREHVLVKSDKLYTHELDSIRHRFKLIRKHIENHYNVRKLQALMSNGPEDASGVFAEIEARMGQEIQDLDHDFEMILQANRPTILAQEVSQRLQLIQQKRFELDSETLHLLNDYELSRLSIARGSLDPDERLEIESHVTHTFHFLSQIPWTRELRNVPQIAYAHHEKLNGRGYPRGLDAAAIPVQARMMTIADIYDALTASDRPYKKALPVEKALDILGFEVKDGMLDGELYRLFVDARIYEQIGQS